jgi:hypothetical protein
MADDFVLGRGKVFCRGCGGTELFSALDLGQLPIANELWANEHEIPENFPLQLRICTSCGLGQVEDVVTPSRLFRDYRYLSSISASFIEHARKYVVSAVETLQINQADWVLEVASNDGYLLQHFVDMGIRVLGVEPAENVAKIAVEAGVPTISEFFGVEVAKSIVAKMGHPRLVIANNVMAHVPDLQDFVAGLAEIAGPHTIISVENPSLMNFLDDDQFDTIYHEHFSYLTAFSVDKIADRFGLKLINVEKINTHGGSNRYWMTLKSAASRVDSRVAEQIQEELDGGLFDKSLWENFSLRIQSVISNFHDWLKNSFEEGRIVFGYGAAAKASTLLNAAKIDKSWLKAIADGSHEKQGRYMPVNGIPILSPEEMFRVKPTDVVIFPWNIQDELVAAIEKESGGNIRIWKAIPHLERIG